MTTTIAPPTDHPCAAINAEYQARVAIELDTAAAELRALADWLADATVTELTDRYAPAVTVEQLDTAEWPAPVELQIPAELGEHLAELQASSVNSAEVVGWVPEVPAGFDRVRAFAEMEARADRMTTYMHADDTPPGGLTGVVVRDEPDPANESRRERWARTAGDILASIGRGR